MSLSTRLQELDRSRDAVLAETGSDFEPALRAHLSELNQGWTRRHLDALRAEAIELSEHEERADTAQAEYLRRVRDSYLGDWQSHFPAHPLSDEARERNAEFDEMLADSTWVERHRRIWFPRTGFPWRTVELEGALADIVTYTIGRLPAMGRHRERSDHRHSAAARPRGSHGHEAGSGTARTRTTCLPRI